MSALFDKVKADQLAARKAKDGNSVPLLSTLLGQIQKVAKDKGIDKLADGEVVAEVKKFLKSNVEMQAKAVGEALQLAQHEAKLLESYLPKQLSVDEIEAEVGRLVADGKNALGQIMAHFKANFEGRYDGKAVSEAAKKVL